MRVLLGRTRSHHRGNGAPLHIAERPTPEGYVTYCSRLLARGTLVHSTDAHVHDRVLGPARICKRCYRRYCDEHHVRKRPCADET